MKAIIILAVLLVAASARNFGAEFETFKKTYGRVYSTAPFDEEEQRFNVFVKNMKIAEELQLANPLATFGMNEFSDITPEEFKNHHNAEKFYQSRTKSNVIEVKEELGNVTSMDWRKHGAVTYVKNQGNCGSCWSFSVTGSIEGQWYLRGNPLVAVSEQMFVSCDLNCSGCNGCWMDWAFEWVVTNHSGNVYTEDSYPYVSGGGANPACNETGKEFAAHITGHIDLPPHEQQMAGWCATNGPISIGVDATSFQSYTGGIITNCISQQVDHGVLIVGFSLENHGFFQPAYWIIKNSWGTSWGEDGYLRVAYGSDQCLITSHVASATVDKNPTPAPPPPTPSPPIPPPTPSPPLPPGWSNLFDTPYDNVPTSMSGISCTSAANCYVSASMGNGGGNYAFWFNGQLQGTFNPVQLASQPLLLSAISVGGTDSSPKGCVGGAGIGNGLQYFVNSSNFAVAAGDFFTGTIDLRASASGERVLTTDTNVPSGVVFSDSFGATFSTIPISSPMPSNCTSVQYVSMPSDNTWFVTLGSTPSSFPRHPSQMNPVNGPFDSSSSSSQGSGSGNFTNPCNYTAAITKTTDGGKTWNNVFWEAPSNTSLAGIDCFSETQCVAVGTGANGGSIFYSLDGMNFTLVYTLANSGSLSHSIAKVRYASATDVWATATQSFLLWSTLVMLHSTDGGQSWAPDATNLVNVSSVTDLTFTKGGVGFATASLSTGEYTILRYQP